MFYFSRLISANDIRHHVCSGKEVYMFACVVYQRGSRCAIAADKHVNDRQGRNTNSHDINIVWSSDQSRLLSLQWHQSLMKHHLLSDLGPSMTAARVWFKKKKGIWAVDDVENKNRCGSCMKKETLFKTTERVDTSRNKCFWEANETLSILQMLLSKQMWSWESQREFHTQLAVESTLMFSHKTKTVAFAFCLGGVWGVITANPTSVHMDEDGVSLSKHTFDSSMSAGYLVSSANTTHYVICSS